MAGSIQELLQEKADITTSDALYQQMKAPLTQITRVVALMRLLTFFTGTMIVSLLLCMWMQKQTKGNGCADWVWVNRSTLFFYRLAFWKQPSYFLLLWFLPVDLEL
ncbi:MAG: hypothetical protein ACLVEU_02915 [Bacteroides cellulosilyticus]